MTTQVVIGESFTFQVLFLDSQNTPIAVNTPKITVFYFDSQGQKVKVVDAQDLNAAVPAEVGRYTYVYTVPLQTTPHGRTYYGEMSGTNPQQGNAKLLTEQTFVAVTSSSSSSSGGAGMKAQFVKGG